MVNYEDTRSGVELDVTPANYAPQKLVDVPVWFRCHLRQLAFQYMQDGFSVVDAKGLHIDVNPAFCKMTGSPNRNSSVPPPCQLLASGRARTYPDRLFTDPHWRIQRNRAGFQAQE
ncbi:MAG: PAS domain-containing protein [Haliea sp.]|nr:PAS domain-containing protein [Haliea sp.]